MICPECGKRFNVDEAKKAFEHYYSESSHWTYDVLPQPYCFDCATGVADEMWIEGELEDPYADD